MVRDADVLISGLGPTGAVLAGLLGQRGLRVAVFDKLPDLYPLPRAAGIDHEALRIVQELGLAERVAPFIAPYRMSEYRGMDGAPIKRLDAAPPPYRLGWAPNHVFDQPAFERLLRARLAELPTVQCHLSTEVLSVGQDANAAWVDVRAVGASPTVRWRAPYVVACDGGTSPIRKQLGITLEDLGFDEPWLVVDAIVGDAQCAELPQTQVQYCEAARPSTFVIGVGSHRRWELMLLEGDSLSADFPEAELWPLLARWLKPGEAQLWRAAAYRFHGLVAQQWRQGRVLLAGDAAHMTPPFMAQGMVQGLRDAHNLAWKLARVLSGTSSDHLLDSYEAERRPHVQATTRSAMALGRVICERDPERARARDAALRAEHGGSVPVTYRQDMIPGLSAGLLAAGTPGAGTLQPQPWVQAAAASARLDDVAGNGFVLLADDAPDAATQAQLQAALAPLAGTLVLLAGQGRGPGWIGVSEDDGLARPWLAQLGRRYALVRPDRYVYGTAADATQALALVQQLVDELN